MNHQKKVRLILEDGSTYEGYSFGASANTSGEVVFNTGMVGYPESMTDPSYKGQILVLTYPLIGNYGVPAFSTYEVLLRLHSGQKGVSTSQVEKLPKYFESDQIQIQGLIVSDYSQNYSHWNAVKSLGEWMKEFNIPGIYGIDTRALTKKLREKGSMLGQISNFSIRAVGSTSQKGQFPISNKMSKSKIQNPNNELKTKSYQLKADFEDPNKRNLVAEVSIDKPITYKAGKKKVVLVDTGGKYNIIRSLLNRGVTVIRVPWDYDFLKRHPEQSEGSQKGIPRLAPLGLARNDKQNRELGYDGIVITNGPGDPKMCKETIANVKKAMAKNIPIFGICLGNQILALAAGANTYKLKYGHRSQNQPCVEVGTKRCYITSQNHGYAVNAKTLPKGWREWFVNANDGTNEGIRHKSKPFMSVQFHPEATPGPVDTNFLFDRFIEMI